MARDPTERIIVPKPSRLQTLLVDGPIPSDFTTFERLCMLTTRRSISFEGLFSLQMHIVDLNARLTTICSGATAVLMEFGWSLDRTAARTLAFLSAFAKANAAINALHQCDDTVVPPEERESQPPLENILLRLNQPAAPDKRTIDAWSRWLLDIQKEIDDHRVAYTRFREITIQEQERRAAAQAAALAAADALRHLAESEIDAGGSPKRALEEDHHVTSYHPPGKRQAEESGSGYGV